MNKLTTPAGTPIITPAGRPIIGSPTYRTRLLETHKGVQAELAAGGRRRRMAERAIELAESISVSMQLGHEKLYQFNLRAYMQFTQTLGYDPIA